eukprot:2048758-Amphidinium_carterae.1
MVSYRMVKREWERLAPAILEAGLAWQNGARLPESLDAIPWIHCLSYRQHAYVGERGLTSALWQIEGGALHASRVHDQAVMLALDIDAAFPSVNRSWVKMVLHATLDPVINDHQIRMLWQVLEVRDVPFIWRGRKCRG